jgi:hypothetical protein
MLHIFELERRAMEGCLFLRDCEQTVNDEDDLIVEGWLDGEEQGISINIQLDKLNDNQKALSEVILNIMHFRMATMRKKNQFLRIDMSENDCVRPDCKTPLITEGMYLDMAAEVKEMNDLSMGTFAEIILTKLLHKKLAGKSVDANIKPLWQTMNSIVEAQWSGYLKRKEPETVA